MSVSPTFVLSLGRFLYFLNILSHFLSYFSFFNLASFKFGRRCAPLRATQFCVVSTPPSHFLFPFIATLFCVPLLLYQYESQGCPQGKLPSCCYCSLCLLFLGSFPLFLFDPTPCAYFPPSTFGPLLSSSSSSPSPLFPALPQGCIMTAVRSSSL